MLRYIARQPILNAKEQTFGYELLYRAAAENFARIDDSDQAARSVLDDLLTLGFEDLARGRRAFLNCTRELLTRSFVQLLPRENVVLEILESVVPDHDLLQSCSELKSAGYTLALDDFVPTPQTLCLVPFADYIKIDFRLLSLADCGALVRQFGGKIQFVAEKVETRAEYAAAREMGCTLFQGYFFAKPALLTVKQIPPMYMNYIRLLATTCKPEVDFAEVEEIIKTDVALCYKLLRFLNSAAFCLGSEITSLRQALVILGENSIRRWIAVSAAASAAKGKPPELLISALLRARFCERLAVHARCKPYEAFVVGLFSLVPSLLEIPLDQILRRIELPAEARAALLGEPSRLLTMFQIVKEYIEGEVQPIAARSAQLELSDQQVASCYLEAVRSVDSLVSLL